jgi:aspartate/methionine/tyrosine aminotransferase
LGKYSKNPTLLLQLCCQTEIKSNSIKLLFNVSMSGLDEFDLEVYFAKHEFTAKYLFCCSDAESMLMKDLLALADDECKKLWDELSCQYTESPGLPLLREEIAKNYPGLNSDDIFCFSGAEEGIYTTMRALLTKEDHVIVLTPCYQSLKSVASAICGSSTCLELSPNDGWAFPMAALIASIKANTKMLVLNYPHNPTGSYLTESEQTQIIEICRKANIYLFFDEVYRGIECSDAVARLPTLASRYENGISLGVVSKALGLAGLRIGWVASSNKAIITALAGYKHYLSICNSAPSEILALIALRNHDYILTTNTKLVRANLKLLDEFLKRNGDLFSWTTPTAGCCGFMRYIGPGDRNWRIHADELVERTGVMTLPGVFFPNSKPETAYIDHFRVGFGRLNFPEVLREFETAIAVMRK